MFTELYSLNWIKLNFINDIDYEKKKVRIQQRYILQFVINCTSLTSYIS